MKNLRHILREAVMTGFKTGLDKHADKANPEHKEHVYGMTTRGNLLDRVNDFAKFAKSQGVNRAHEIDLDLLNGYLDDKAHKGCSQNTLNQYRAQLMKVGRLMGQDWTEIERTVAISHHNTHRGASAVISAEDFNTLLEYASAHPSGSGYAVMHEREIGVRVGDIQETYIQNKTLYLRLCKGGKPLTRPLTPEIRRILNSKWLKDHTLPDGRIDFPTEGAINTYLRRTEDKLGLERHSYHDLRRFCAQEKYDELRGMGMTSTEALSRVSIWLNHGEKRNQMLKQSYVANVW